MKVLSNSSAMIITLNKSNNTIIKNNISQEIDKIEVFIKNLFLQYGFKNIEYKKYTDESIDEIEKKIYVYINGKTYKKIIKKIDYINHIINKLIILEDTSKFIEIQISKEKDANVYSRSLNTIEISKNMINSLNNIEENEYVHLVNDKGIIQSASIKINDENELGNNEVKFSKSLKKEFNSNINNILIKKEHYLKFNKIFVQKVEDILNGYITISDKNEGFINKHFYSKLELLNPVTGSSIDIDLSKIKYDSSLEKDEIKLNFFQRKILECDFPKKIESFYYNKFKDKLKNYSDYANELKNNYENGKTFSTSDLSSESRYEAERKIKEIMKKCEYPSINMYPIIIDNSNTINIFNNIIDFFLNKIIGGHSIDLKCIRPYEVDENSNSIRLSKSSFDLLGIDETDNVIISYRNKHIRARALIIDDIELILETNILSSKSDFNSCVGIPAYMRNKLGIKRIDTCCKIKRDKKYLFKKNLNIQFLSILATILTIKQTFENIYIIFILSIILLPISIYISFSVVRNRINS